jgi:hypothetical protein
MLVIAAYRAPLSGFPPGALGRRNADSSVPSAPRVRPRRRPRASPAGPRRPRKPTRNHPFRRWLRSSPPGAGNGGQGEARDDDEGVGDGDAEPDADGWLLPAADGLAAFWAAARAVFILARSAPNVVKSGTASAAMAWL